MDSNGLRPKSKNVMFYTDGNIYGAKSNKSEKYPGDPWDVLYHSN